MPTFNYHTWWEKFRSWVADQWQHGHRGNVVISVVAIGLILWWVLKIFWPVILVVSFVIGGTRLYLQYMKGPVKQVTSSTPKEKIVTMPESFRSSTQPSPSTKPPVSMKVSMRLIGITAALIIAAIVFTRFLVVVQAGTVGVYSLFGKVSPNEMSSGLNFVNPLGKVEKMSIRTEAYTMSIAQEEGQRVGDDSIDALTKEGLQLKLDITVLYSLVKEKASDVYLQLGREYAEKVIRPEIRSAIREVAAQYDANAVYSEKRTEMTGKIAEALKTSLAPRGISVEDVLLRNVILPQKLSDSIQEKLQADQEQQRYDFVLQKEEKEAERKRIEAAGQRDSQKIIADGLTPSYLNYLYIQNLKDNKGTIYVPTNPTTGLPLFKGVGQ